MSNVMVMASLTEWLPAATPPVYVGEYEVELKTLVGDLLSEPVVVKARWEKRLGQFGFWMTSKSNTGGVSHQVSTLLDVKYWRGLKRPMLSDEGKVALDLMIFSNQTFSFGKAVAEATIPRKRLQ